MPRLVEPDPAAAVRERALWDRVRAAGDAKARAELTSLYLPFARMMAATVFARRVDDDIEFADYHQWALLGMMEAIDRFDPGRGILFRSFAQRRIRGRILDGLDAASEKRRQVAVRRALLAQRLEVARSAAEAPSPRAEAAGAASAAAGDASLFAYLAEVGIGLALGRVLEGTGMFDDPGEAAAVPDQAYARVEVLQLRRQVRHLVSRLSPQERAVVQSHYLHGELFEEVARRLGLSRGRVAQVHRAALGKLRAMLADARWCDVAL